MTTSPTTNPTPGVFPGAGGGNASPSLRTLLADLREQAPRAVHRLLRDERHWLFVAVPFAILLGRVAKMAWPTWFAPDSVLQFQAFVPLFAAALVWARRRPLEFQYRELAMAFPEDSPKRRGNPLLVIAGCLLMLFASIALATQLGLLGGILAVAGVAYYLYGPFLFRSLWQPLLFLFLCIPPPGLFLPMLVLQLRAVMTGVSALLLRPLYPGASPNGLSLVLPGFVLQITPAMSGAFVLLPVAAFALWVALLRRMPIILGLCYLAASSVVALVLNLVRVLFVAFVGVSNPTLGEALQRTSSVVLVLIALALVYRMAPLFRVRRRSPIPVTLPAAEPAPTPASAAAPEERSEVDEIEALFRAEAGDGGPKKER